MDGITKYFLNSVFFPQRKWSCQWSSQRFCLLSLILVFVQWPLSQEVDVNAVFRSKPSRITPAPVGGCKIYFFPWRKRKNKLISTEPTESVNSLDICVCVITRPCFEIALSSKAREVLFLHAWIIKSSSTKIKVNMGIWEWAGRNIWIPNIFVTD